MWFGKLESSVETGRLLSVALSIKNISELFYLDHTLGYRMGPIPSLQAVFQGSEGHLQFGPTSRGP